MNYSSLRHSTLIAVIVLLAVSLMAQQPAQAPYSLSIAIEKPSVASGETVKVTVQVTNTSDHPIAFPVGAFENFPERDFNVDVHDASGVLAPETVFRKKTKESGVGSVPGLQLNPGEKLERTLRINKVVDMTNPGIYTIQVWRTWGKLSGRQQMRVNTGER